MTLFEVLERATLDTPGVERVEAEDGALTWVVAGRTVAALSADGGTASFRLDPTVADAASRTPDVRPSAIGAGWVELSPAVVDGHAADRATAWFASAYRRAVGGGG